MTPAASKSKSTKDPIDPANCSVTNESDGQFDSGPSPAKASCRQQMHTHSLIESADHYNCMHAMSVNEPIKFWMPIIDQFKWGKYPSKEHLCEQNLNVDKGPVYVRWLTDATTNITENCLDRHIESGHGDEVAFHWIGNDPARHLDVTYNQLLSEVCQLSSALKRLAGVKAGDTVGIYMGMCPQVLVSMLATARLGAVHVVVFGGFSSSALAKRLFDSKAKVLITMDGCYRGAKFIDMEQCSLQAKSLCEQMGHRVDHLIIKQHHKKPDSHSTTASIESAKIAVAGDASRTDHKFVDYDDFIRDMPVKFDPVYRKGNDTLFILHTSGSTGMPKGIEHSHGGYMVYAWTTMRYSFDAFRDDDVFFCTGDVGWITGHTYNCYGPLLNRTRFLLFEGIPLYPTPDRYWQICDDYGVTHLYTAPTAIRACLAHGNDIVLRHKMSKLKVLGTVGEPTSESAWKWFSEVVGRGRCKIVDTYFQTETGGHVITNLAGVFDDMPGCAYKPFFGTQFAILDDDGQEIEVAADGDQSAEGFLVMKSCGPGMMKGIFNRAKDFSKIYFERFKGYYFTGDGARRDREGFYWITGRVDDMMNCSGHLLSSSEIENAIASHALVSECSVVGVRHQLKSETPYAFVVLMSNDVQCQGGGDYTDSSASLSKELLGIVRARIGPFAMPERVVICKELPKTRSGKIMRRLLRIIASSSEDNRPTSYGDLSSLTNPAVIDDIFDVVHGAVGSRPASRC